MNEIIEKVIKIKTLRPIRQIIFDGSCCQVYFSDGHVVQQIVTPAILLEISLWMGNNLNLTIHNSKSKFVNPLGHKVCLINTEEKWQDLALLGARLGDSIIVNNDLLIVLK